MMSKASVGEWTPEATCGTPGLWACAKTRARQVVGENHGFAGWAPFLLSFNGRSFPDCDHLPFSSVPSLLISPRYSPPTPVAMTSRVSFASLLDGGYRDLGAALVRTDHHSARSAFIVRQPILNIHYYNSGAKTVKLRISSSAFFLPSLPVDWYGHREIYEDRFWDEVISVEQHGTGEPDEVAPTRPLFMTVYGQPLTRDQVENIRDTKSVLYVMATFHYEDILGSHESDVCGYIFGDTRALHQCQKHNGP